MPSASGTANQVPDPLVPVAVLEPPEPSPGRSASYKAALLVGFERFHVRESGWRDDPEVAGRLTD